MPSSSWRIVADPRAARDLKKIDRQNPAVSSHLIRAIDSLPHQPYAGKPLKGAKRGSCSLRVGDFRVIYELYPAEKTIHLIHVGDRKNVYR